MARDLPTAAGETVSPSLRRGALLGAICTLPLLVWWGAQDLSAALAADSPLQSGLGALWVLLAVALPLLARPALPGMGGLALLGEPAGALWAALPPLTLVWLSGAAPLRPLALGAASIWSYAVVLGLLESTLLRAARNRAFGLGLGRSLRLLVCALVWSQRAVWLPWFGV